MPHNTLKDKSSETRGVISPTQGGRPPSRTSAGHQSFKAKVRPYVKTQPASAASWPTKDLCAAYDWPRNLDGGGIIAIIEVGGSWIQSDIDEYFKQEGLPAPHVVDVTVDGTENRAGAAPNSADREVTADIQIAGASYAVATGKAATIRVYWSKDITAAILMATLDGCDVCCVTWGADEEIWGRSAALALEEAALEATVAGMIIFAASGDNDSSDGGQTPSNVDLPASAPHIIGCGGTTKSRKSETVWNSTPGRSDGRGTGGGYSRYFTPMPTWQVGAPHASGRMVPDLAANADPSTGYEIIFRGAREVAGGTSAATALYTGLFAAFGCKLGFVTPELYLHSACFTDITSGDNGAQRAKTGPDSCTGLGSPIGTRLASQFANPATTLRRQLREAQEEIRRLRAIAAGVNHGTALLPSSLAPRIQPGDVYQGPWQDRDGIWWVQLYDANLQPGPIQRAAVPGLTPRIMNPEYLIQPGDVCGKPWRDRNGVWWAQLYDAHLQPGDIVRLS
jgi:kumamolisin